MPSRDLIVAAVDQYCRTMTDNDQAAWLKIWADDIVLEDPVGVTSYRGVAELRTTFWTLVQSSRPIRIWLKDDVIVCGNEAIAILAGEVTMGGTTRAMGPIVDHFIFNEDGKIVSLRAFWKYG